MTTRGRGTSRARQKFLSNEEMIQSHPTNANENKAIKSNPSAKAFNIMKIQFDASTQQPSTESQEHMRVREMKSNGIIQSITSLVALMICRFEGQLKGESRQ